MIKLVSERQQQREDSLERDGRSMILVLVPLRVRCALTLYS